MRSECKICKKWKEQMYWSDFQGVQFFQILSEIFDQQLIDSNWRCIIPQRWVERFVNAHSLEEDDLLIFKYNGSSRFDVSVFDRQSLCKKEASCFVKKCEHADVASRRRTKRHTPRQYSSRDVSEAPPTKKPKLAATPTSEDTSKSSSHDEYEPPEKKKTLASTSTSVDTNEFSSHNECESPTEKKTTLASTSTSRTRSARANAKLLS
ncbi:hypothetical protein CQW23_32870 [Capsicum baccatum]|uniref:TF-B3 domain-containing protein n=1 Tax=Capsicum baccatum TaxID=33114 RepID=A0A2G2V3F4_CAPBA|nr:hypothetical protein CQW23_32870 [Capsicum baccatum]